ncbi:hypothetical protein HY78_01015 [Rhizorhabdus wittichii DC-6]|nr:hypothetical protein HY78_01015 [Rhizorhabdus wittichii DC-6]
MGWYPHTVTAAPASEPVTLEEAQGQVLPGSVADDAVLTRYIKAARAHVEGICGTPLVSRTIAVKCDRFADFAAVPTVPLFEVSAIEYVDAAGAAQTLSPDVYEVRSDGLVASIALKPHQSWPGTWPGSRITLTADVGYDEVPEHIKQAMLLLIGHWFENREATGAEMSKIPLGFDDLLVNDRSFA